MDSIQIFRPGQHTAMDGRRLSFAEADLAAAAAAYDPAVHEAPIVVGHPRTDAPAYGWVAGLATGKGGALEATPRQIDPAFAELVRAGRYKHVSASFYLPDSPANPKPGQLYLRHVGFLGAEPPAIKGLRPVAFAEAEGVVEFADGWALGTVARLLRNVREWIITSAGQERADAILPSYDLDSVAAAATVETVTGDGPAIPSYSEKEETGVAQSTEEAAAQAEAERARRAAELERRAAELAQREAAFAEREATQRQAADVAWCDAQIQAGRMLPAHRALTLGLLARLDPAESVAFGEAGQLTEAEALRRLLGSYPKLVEFGEVAGGGGGALPDNASAADIERASIAYQEELRAKGILITNIQAIRHVTGRGN